MVRVPLGLVKPAGLLSSFDAAGVSLKEMDVSARKIKSPGPAEGVGVAAVGVEILEAFEDLPRVLVMRGEAVRSG